MSDTLQPDKSLFLHLTPAELENAEGKVVSETYRTALERFNLKNPKNWHLVAIKDAADGGMDIELIYSGDVIGVSARSVVAREVAEATASGRELQFMIVGRSGYNVMLELTVDARESTDGRPDLTTQMNTLLGPISALADALRR